MNSVPANGPRPTASEETIERELALEQAHVDRVYDQLKIAHSTAEQAAAQGNSMYQIDRGDYAREEDGTALFERDAFTFQARRRLAVLDAEHEGLVFGRLDQADGEVRYIGRIGVRDDDYEPLVIDWRAPAAEPFYRATPGNPMSVARRRVLRCRGERVVGIEDDLLDAEAQRDDLVVVGEGALMAALSRARGHQMRDIVATIQAEQDEAIRAPYQGVTVISGGPGTGKTVVALHRAAYLLYSHRRRFEHGGVLVVGPSAVFMNYIERVLPSLGEDSVTLRPIGAVAADVIRRGAERVDSAPVARLKGSLAMVPLLKRLVAEPLTDPSLDLRVVVKGEVLTLTPPELRRVRSDVLAGHQLNRGRAAAEKALCGALWAKLPEGVDVERALFDEIVTEQAVFTMFLHAWWPVLSPQEVLARAADRELLGRVGARQLAPADLDALAASFADRSRGWSVADVALLDEVFGLIGPPPAEAAEHDPTEFLLEGAEISELVSLGDVAGRTTEADPDDEGYRTFAHVLVDEAQDITPMQWRMLRRRGPQASWTIVGDPAQSSWPDPGETAKALDDLIGTAPSRRFRMSTNYRSPAEVFDLAARIVTAAYPEADLPTAVRSTGVAPTLDATTEAGLADRLVALVTGAGTEVEGTIGVVAPASRLAALRGLLAERSATDAALRGLAERVVVLSALEAKGLEYDAVIVVDADGIVEQTAGGVRALYVALTRPTQRLHTLDVNAGAVAGAWRAPLG